MAVNDFIMPECTYNKYQIWKKVQKGKLYLLSTFIDNWLGDTIKVDVLSNTYFQLKLDFFKINNKYIKKTEKNTYYHKRTFQFRNKKTNLIFGFCDLTDYIKTVESENKDFVYRMLCVFIERGGIVRIGDRDYVFGEESDLKKCL